MSISDKIVTLQNVLLVVSKLVDMATKVLDYIVNIIDNKDV